LSDSVLQKHELCTAVEKLEIALTYDKGQNQQMESIDLSGPDGNAFYIMAVVQKVCRKKGIDFRPIQQQLMAGDYQNLLDVVRTQFPNDIRFRGR
jgi:hypothetical protein